MNNPIAAMIVIGDEILSGRTRDSNMHYLAKKLAKVGITLKEVRIISDDEHEIIASTNELRKRFEYVFTSGGIGPTHDDITANSIAKAFNLKIGVRPDAKKLLKDYYKKNNIKLNASRLRMARIPEKAALINNPISAAPGFKIENVYVMAGVPSIFQSMLDLTLTNMEHGSPLNSKSVILNLPEGEIAAELKTMALENPNISFGSYPFLKDGKLGTDIVLRGRNMKLIISLAEKIETTFNINKESTNE